MIVNNYSGFYATIMLNTDESCSSVIATRNGLITPLKWNGSIWVAKVPAPGTWEVVATKDGATKSVQLEITQDGAEYTAQITWAFNIIVTSDFVNSGYVEFVINGVTYDVKNDVGTYQTVDPITIKTFPNISNVLEVRYNGRIVANISYGQTYTFTPVADTNMNFVRNSGYWRCYITT